MLGTLSEVRSVYVVVIISGSKRPTFSTDGQKRGPETSTPRIGGLVDDVTTSESESESESDYESDRERPPGGHVIILDASKNQATDTKETLRGRAVGDKGHYKVRWLRGIGGLELVSSTGKKKKQKMSEEAVRLGSSAPNQKCGLVTASKVLFGDTVSKVLFGDTASKVLTVLQHHSRLGCFVALSQKSWLHGGSFPEVLAVQWHCFKSAVWQYCLKSANCFGGTVSKVLFGGIISKVLAVWWHCLKSANCLAALSRKCCLVALSQ